MPFEIKKVLFSHQAGQATFFAVEETKDRSKSVSVGFSIGPPSVISADDVKAEAKRILQELVAEL